MFVRARAFEGALHLIDFNVAADVAVAVVICHRSLWQPFLRGTVLRYFCVQCTKSLV